MTFAGSEPVDWLLPGLLGLAWLTLWVARKRIPPWFFAVGAILAVLCFPAGLVAGRLELGDTNCTPDNLCFSADGVDWWWNGILGLLTNAVLALVTAGITSALAVARRTRSTGRRSPRRAPRRPADPLSKGPTEPLN